MDLSPYASLNYCYLATTGRTSGLPREIEIWFAVDGERLYLMAGSRDRAHWVRNLQVTPAVIVRLGEATFSANARVLEPETPEDALARRLLFEKYSRSGSLTSWRDTALPVALDVEGLV